MAKFETLIVPRGLSGKKCNELSHVTLQDFEQVVLETALENVVSKYSRHLEIIKPALEMLLQQVSIFPSINNPLSAQSLESPLSGGG